MFHVQELTGDKGHNLPTHPTAPSVHHPYVSAWAALEQISSEHTLLEEKWKKKRKAMGALVAQVKASKKKMALKRLVEVQGEDEVEKEVPKSQTGQQAISDEVKALVAKKVVGDEMTNAQAAITFDISASSVSHIV
jgi:hypothetical protein